MNTEKNIKELEKNISTCEKLIKNSHKLKYLQQYKELKENLETQLIWWLDWSKNYE